MNIITIAGNITKDAELRYLSNGDAVAGFSVADNQGKDKPAIFWNCSLFGKRGEALAQYLTKGQSVTVVGTVTERKWTDKDGVERYAKDIRVVEVSLQGGRREAPVDSQEQPSQREIARNRQAAACRQAGAEIDDTDIPF